jgi:flagellar protein FlaJ
VSRQKFSLRKGNKKENEQRVGVVSKGAQYGVFDLLFYNSGFAKRLAKSFDEKLKRAGLSDDPRIYASRLISFLLISSILTVVMLVFGGFLFLDFLRLHDVKYLAVGMMMIIFGIIIPPLVYLVYTINVSQRIESRRIGIDSETPIFSSVFLVFLKAGLNVRFVFDYLARSNALANISGISAYISKRMKFLGESTEEAITNSLPTSPSKLFNDFLTTYVTAIRTGAPVVDTIYSKTKDLLKAVEVSAADAASKLEGIGEGYVIWLSSGFITFFLAMIIEALFPSFGGGSSFKLLGAMAVLLIPAINLLFVYIVDATQFKFPERPLKANKLFFITFPVGLLVMFVILAIINKIPPFVGTPNQLVMFLTLSGAESSINPTVIAITIGLLIASIPPGILAMKEVKRGTGYDIYVVAFLRAVSEGLRAGLSPEAVIRNLRGSKEMGKFNTVLDTIDIYNRLGYPLKDSFKKAAEQIMDFSSKVSLISLADMIEIGSLTPETVEFLADQISTQIRIRREYISRIKVLLYTPYVGIILALVASVLLGNSMVYVLSQQHGASLSYGPLAEAQVLLPNALYIISVSSLFNSFLAGLLVGKLSSGRTSVGLIHSAILVIITVILLIIAQHITLVSTARPTF